MFKKWFEPINKMSSFYIGRKKKVAKIQQRIELVRFPGQVNRISFDLQHWKQWKASEYRVFFLYLSLKVLKGILGTKYYRNLCCLVYAIKKLHYLKDKSQIAVARELLDCFSSTYVTLYGKTSCTFTFHVLSKHLINNVIQHGSLCTHSMFSLEGNLGYIEKSLSGTRGFSKQYINSKSFPLNY